MTGRRTASTDVRMLGVIVESLEVHRDRRGHLIELFRADDPSWLVKPAMGYLSVTLPGEFRGPHEHVHQHDRFCFPGPGDFHLILWDARPDSPSHGRRVVLAVGARNPCTVVVPPGVVHAYQCSSSESGLVVNLPDDLYGGPGRQEAVDEIRHEDDAGSRFTREFAEVCQRGSIG